MQGKRSDLVLQTNQEGTHHQNGLCKHQLTHQHNKQHKLNAISSFHPSSQFFFKSFFTRSVEFEFSFFKIGSQILNSLSLSLSLTHTHTHREILSFSSTSKSWLAAQGHALYKFNHSTTIVSGMSPSDPFVSRSSSRYIYWYSYLGILFAFWIFVFFFFFLHVFDNLSMYCLRKWMKECWAKW